MARTVLSIALALLLISTGSGKLAGLASSHQIRASINVSVPVWRMIGVFELMVVVGLVVGIWLPPVGLAAALGAVVLMIGAIVTRLRAGGEQLKTGITADAVFLVAASATAIMGIDLMT